MKFQNKSNFVSLFTFALLIFFVSGMSATQADSEVYKVIQKNEIFLTSEDNMYEIVAKSNDKSIKYEVSKERYDGINIGDKVEKLEEVKSVEFFENESTFNKEIIVFSFFITFISVIVFLMILSQKRNNHN